MRSALVRMHATLPAKYHHHPGAFSVLLKNYLLDKYVGRHGRAETSQRIGRFFDPETVDAMGKMALELSRDEIETLIETSAIPIRYLDVDSLYRKRVAERALEELTTAPVCPEVLILPGAMGDAEGQSPLDPPLLRGAKRGVHAVAFEYFPFIVNEFYALAVDCYSANVEHFGKEKVFLAGVHRTWFDKDGVHRCLWWTGPEDDLLMESDLHEPLKLESLQTIFASPKIHRDISELCRDSGVFELNPYEAASIADDKYACFQSWTSCSVPTPESLLITRKASSQDLEKSVRSWAQGKTMIVVQPNSGTEGQGVQAFDTLSEMDAAVGYLRILTSQRGAIVREARGNVFYRPKGSDELLACDLRLNVCFDGTEYRAQSGYMQVASNPNEFASSVSIGGKVEAFHRNPFERLVAVDESGSVHPLELTESDLDHLSGIAEKAAECLKGIYLVGIDLKLEAHRNPVGGWSLEAFVLDANPRPAGLMQSDKFSKEDFEPCISPGLWVAFEKLF